MNLHVERLDRVTLLGAAISLISLIPPFFVVKANRIVNGTPQSLFHIGALWAVLITAAAVAALCLALATAIVPDRRQLLIPRILVGSALFFIPWLAVGASGPGFLTSAMAAGRISPTTGLWLQMLGSYVLLNGALRDLRNAVAPLVVVVLFAGLAALIGTGYLGSLSVLKEFQNSRSRFFEELTAHLVLSGVAVAAAVVIGMPLGILAWRRRAFEQPVFVFVNGIQTIPSLALFGIMIAPLSWLSHQIPVLREIGIRGIGNAPALIALTLYALLPITRNTYTSLSVIDRAVVDAGRGMGMSRFQMLRLVEVPLSLPIILGGIRTSAVQAVGNTAVAALIGAGGLGAFVFQGLGQAAPDLILLGVFPIILLAVLVDRLMKYLVRYLTPRGIRQRAEPAGAAA